jgi:hypothetical protein
MKMLIKGEIPVRKRIITSPESPERKCKKQNQPKGTFLVKGFIH